jgi:hypothetical protein
MKGHGEKLNRTQEQAIAALPNADYVPVFPLYAGVKQ